MESKLELQQLSISIIANNYNPARITPDFLQASGIIPEDWELAAQPNVSPNLTQLKFKNGLSLVAQPGIITLSEAISNSGFSTMEAANFARRYVNALPAANYQLLKISPRSIYNFGFAEDTVRQLMMNALLTPSPWHSFGSVPVKAEVNLLYKLEHCQLSLNIDEVRWQKAETNAIPALLLAGDFNYSLVDMDRETKLKSLHKAIDNWQQDVILFQEKISENIIKTALAGISPQLELPSQSEPEKVLH